MIPNYVLILSGDHIYKMDYAKMLASPQRTEGRLPPSLCMEVPMEEASRFGIMNAG